MAALRLFAAARLAAGTGRTTVPGATVGDVLDGACARFGDDLRDVLPSCQIWLNGEATDRTAVVGDDDEIGILPPVSGGAA